MVVYLADLKVVLKDVGLVGQWVVMMVGMMAVWKVCSRDSLDMKTVVMMVVD